MRPNPEHLIRLLINETFVFRQAVVGGFVLITMALLAVGFVWPKGYTSSTTILIDEKNIIRPLMEGTAVPTEVADRSRLASEVIFGRKIMNQILVDGGWLEDESSPEEQEKIIERLIKQTKVSIVGRNLIKIEYKDNDPERAKKITEKYAELFITESLSNKVAESQAAYEFIEKQVQEYHEKLVKAEEDLKEFRSLHLDARPGSEADISRRLDTLRSTIEQTTQELKETEIKKQLLEKQLSGEVETASTITRENQYRTRITELQGQLETLRLSYHETYPDIVRIRHQIADLNEALEAEKQSRDAAKASGRVVIDEGVTNTPIYQQLRRELSQAQIAVDTLKSRIAETNQKLHAEIERGRRMHGGEATLAELTRDYVVNRDIYQDLLRRRENARVSMNLDKEKQGLTFRIQEPATLPLQASGIRFMHFIIASLILGTLVPVGLVYAKIQMDPRVRLGMSIAERYKLPLLGMVPHYWTPRETQVLRREVGWLVAVIIGTVGVIALFAVLRIVKVV